VSLSPGKKTTSLTTKKNIEKKTIMNVYRSRRLHLLRRVSFGLRLSFYHHFLELFAGKTKLGTTFLHPRFIFFFPLLITTYGILPKKNPTNFLFAVNVVRLVTVQIESKK